MIDKDRLSNLIEFRMWHAEQGGDAPEEWFTEVPDILSKNLEETSAYIRSCTEEQINYLSEIFEEISDKMQSEEFIKFLKELEKEHPNLNMKKEIQWAEYAMED